MLNMAYIILSAYVTKSLKRLMHCCSKWHTNTFLSPFFFQMVFFPECFDHVGESKEQSIQLAESLDGALLSEYKKLALEKSLWLSLGGYHEKVQPFHSL